MADKKISQLTGASTPLAGTEVLPIVQGGATVKVSAADVTAGRAVSASSLTLTGSPLGTSSGGTGLASFTANGVVYASSASALATSGALAWDAANKLTLFRTTAVEAQEPTVAFSNKVFATQNPGVVKSSNGGLALDIQSPSDATFTARSRIYMNGGAGSVVSVQTSADNGSTWTTRAEFDSGNVKINNGNLVVGTSGKGIIDTNGNESMLFTATASAVNELTVANAATGNRPTISATGGDTNIGINLTPKGTGVVAVNNANSAMTAPLFYSATGVTASIGIGATVTIYDMGGNAGLYYVAAHQSDGGIVWRNSAQVFFNGASSSSVTTISSNLVTVTTSGTNIQLTNNSVSDAITLRWSVVRVL